jgi:arginine decarboxylase
MNRYAWTVQDASELYGVADWGDGYFGIGSEGHVVVRPSAESNREVDLYEIVQGLEERDLGPPIVLRFTEILADRLRTLRSVFQQAIEESGYRGSYLGVYPVKVNQQRPVVEEVLQHGGEHEFGLEVGSKPELLAVTALTAAAPDRMIVCNGFKDRAYVRGVVTATRLGRRIIPVIEKPGELDILLEEVRGTGVRQPLGVRVRLSSQGAGRWEASLGDRAKFGLKVGEILELLEILRDRELLDPLVLVHCHPGSQVEDIARLKETVAELAHLYCELIELGAGLRYLDVGGGLGVNYGGPPGEGYGSINYTLEQYANEIVYRVGMVCDDRDIPHPTIVTESGRASAAHQSVLVTRVIGSAGADEPSPVMTPDRPEGETAAEDDEPQPITDLRMACESVERGALVEAYHDARQARAQVLELFRLGYMGLEGRARGERLYWEVCRGIQSRLEALHEPAEIPVELEEIPDLLSSTYFCNFSLFQSLPDSWAIDQLFPVIPIHRLDERPTVRAVLADLTCDSDGRIARFPLAGEIRQSLDVHPLRDGEPYYLAVFLVGAYQETLGTLHNLFGDSHVVHLHFHDEGGWWIEEVVHGDTIREVLTYSQYETDRFGPTISRDCEQAVREGRMTVTESREIQKYYAAELDGYTYLESD